MYTERLRVQRQMGRPAADLSAVLQRQLWDKLLSILYDRAELPTGSMSDVSMSEAPLDHTERDLLLRAEGARPAHAPKRYK